MKKSNFILTFFLCLISIFAIAQGPENSPKLEKENGFNAIKIGAKLSAIKSVLQKDMLPKKDSWKPNGGMDGITEIYLVDLSKPGYQTFLGKKIERIEVYISPYFSDDEKPIVWEFKIFFKKISDKDCSDLFSKMFSSYGGAYPVLDIPREGDQSITWFSESVLMVASSYNGDAEKPKDDYFLVHFMSAKGG